MKFLGLRSKRQILKIYSLFDKFTVFGMEFAMNCKTNIIIVLQKYLLFISAIVYLLCSTHDSNSQTILFEKNENKFSSNKVQNQTDSTKTEGKQSNKKKINMKIPIYAGLITGGLIGIGSYISEVHHDKKPNREGAEVTYSIDPPSGIAAILGGIIGFAFGFLITGAIMQARLRHSNNDQTISDQIFQAQNTYLKQECQIQGIKFIKYEYKF